MASAFIVAALSILQPRLAVADVNVDLVVLHSQTPNMGSHGMLTAIARAVHEPDGSLAA